MSESRLLHRLIALRRTVRMRLGVYGVCATASGAAFAFLAIAALDWLLDLPPLPRLVTGLVFVIGGIVATMRWVVRPLLRTISLGQIAGKLEEYQWRLDSGSVGQFEDRLSSTVDFLLGNQAGSEEMRRQVIANTDRMVENIRFRDALSMRPLLLRGVALVVAVGLLVVLRSTWPGFVTTGVHRYVAPFGAVRWPRNVEIVPLSSDTNVAVGESATLRMKVIRGLTPTLRGVVKLRSPDGQVTSQAMQREGQDEFACGIAAITEDLTCWFEAGDDSTRHRPISIRVVQRPAVVEALAAIDPPGYALEAPSLVVDLRAGAVSAVVGSSVTVSVRTSKAAVLGSSGGPAASLVFEDGAAVPLDLLEVGHGRSLEGSFVLESDARFRVRVEDADGLENRADPWYRVVAEPDRIPAVVLVEPHTVAEVTPKGSVSLLVRAEDDFGVTAMRIVGRRIDSATEIALSITDRMSVTPSGEGVLALAEHVWDLAPLGLSPGEGLIYHVEATDNYAYRGAGPQVGRSPQQRIKIISQVEFENRLGDHFALLQDRIRQAMLDQETLEDKTAAVARSIKADSPQPAAQGETVAGLGVRQGRLASRIQSLSQRFRGIGRGLELNNIDNATLRQQVRHLARRLREVAAGPASTAARRLSDAGSAGAAQRRELLTRANAAQRQAIDALADMIRFMDQWGDFQETVAKTRDLLDRQQNLRRKTAELGRQTLGQRPDALSEQQQARLREAMRRQLQLATETGQLLERLRRLADRLGSKDPAGAAALEEALRAGLAADVETHMREASEAVESNRMAAAAIEQRVAESGLAGMIAGLQERRKRELAELAKRIENAHQAVAELLRRQREQLQANVEAHHVGAAPEVFVRQADQQHTLRRSALHLADDIEELHEAAGPGRLVRRSAVPMGQAEAALQGADSPEAQARQSEAVELLAQAAARLEEIARKTAEKAWKRSLAALKAKLESIRSRQQDINDESAAIIALVAGKQRLTRREYRKVARLARTQTGLRPDVEAVRQRLGEAAVYRWVIDHVLELVGQSREALAARRLDDALADAQQQIVDELDLLIDALNEAAELPSPDEYAEGRSGGGSGGSRADRVDESPVPSVAELLVLKSMQVDLNSRTARAARDFDPDTASEQQLGRLQRLAARQEKVRELTETVTSRARREHP